VVEVLRQEPSHVVAMLVDEKRATGHERLARGLDERVALLRAQKRKRNAAQDVIGFFRAGLLEKARHVLRRLFENLHARIVAKLLAQTAHEVGVRLDEDELPLRSHFSKNGPAENPRRRAVLNDHAACAQVHFLDHPPHQKWRRRHDRRHVAVFDEVLDVDERVFGQNGQVAKRAFGSSHRRFRVRGSGVGLDAWRIKQPKRPILRFSPIAPRPTHKISSGAPRSFRG
jgi:hypothetical protein